MRTSTAARSEGGPSSPRLTSTVMSLPHVTTTYLMCLLLCARSDYSLQAEGLLVLWHVQMKRRRWHKPGS